MKEPSNVTLDDQKMKIAEVFARLQYKLNCNVKNNTKNLLAFDLLQQNVKKDLLTTSLITLEETFLDLLDSQENISDQKIKRSMLELIRRTTEKFLTRHYGCDVELSSRFLNRSKYVKFLLDDREIIFTTPLYTLMGSKLSKFRMLFVPVYNYTSEIFIESLLDNLIVELSNCVVYLTIVDFATLYTLRHTVYKSRFLSLRNLECFKNNLSWQVKVYRFLQRPLDLYTNRYGLYIIKAKGIYYRSIYANRSKEINSLTGPPLLTILFFELKDFLVSRFDEIFYSVGNSLRLLLTSVLGQIIALIWRGIIEGLKKSK